jgi:glucosamine-6-phosphate deaminase
MRLVRARTPGELAAEAADIVAACLRENPHSVLALPTGRTPIGLYGELVRRSHLGELDLSEARIFNLDEYCGIPATDPSSFAAALQRHLIEPCELRAAQVRLFDGAAADLEAECRCYERALAECGGIDLCVLGVGANGHIAFNEPGAHWNRRTHVVELAPSTRAAFEAARPGRAAPTHGLTLGIQNILEARRVLLLIASPDKRAATAALYRGVADNTWPVTCLAGHSDATVIELYAPACPP